jgi:heat shock protein HslJ
MKKIKLYEILAFVAMLSLTVLAGISCSHAQADNQKLEGVTWVLQSYGNPDKPTAVLQGKELTLSFDRAKGQVSGNGGVNGFGGNYVLSGNKLTVTDIVHTMMASTNQAENEQETAYFKLLAASKTFKIDGKQLTITGTEGTLVFTEK